MTALIRCDCICYDLNAMLNLKYLAYYKEI